MIFHEALRHITPHSWLFYLFDSLRTWLPGLRNGAKSRSGK